MNIEYVSRNIECISMNIKCVSKKIEYISKKIECVSMNIERFSICMAGVSFSCTPVSAGGTYGALYLGCMHKKSRSLLNGFLLYAIVF